LTRLTLRAKHLLNRLFGLHPLRDRDAVKHQADADTNRLSRAARELAAAVAELDRPSATWTVIPVRGGSARSPSPPPRRPGAAGRAQLPSG